MIETLTELENKAIGCWCTDNCHGEILIKLYREFVENLPPQQIEIVEKEKTFPSKRVSVSVEREKNLHPRKKVKIDFWGKGWNSRT